MSIARNIKVFRICKQVKWLHLLGSSKCQRKVVVEFCRVHRTGGKKQSRALALSKAASTFVSTTGMHVLISVRQSDSYVIASVVFDSDNVTVT